MLSYKTNASMKKLRGKFKKKTLETNKNVNVIYQNLWAKVIPQRKFIDVNTDIKKQERSQINI